MHLRQNRARKWNPGKQTSEKIYEKLHFQGVTFILEVQCVCVQKPHCQIQKANQWLEITK